MERNKAKTRKVLERYAKEIIELKEETESGKQDWVEYELYAPRVLGFESPGITSLGYYPTGDRAVKLNPMSPIFDELLRLPSFNDLVDLFCDNDSVHESDRIFRRGKLRSFGEDVFECIAPIEQLVAKVIDNLFNRPVDKKYLIMVAGIHLDEHELVTEQVTVRLPQDSDFSKKPGLHVTRRPEHMRGNSIITWVKPNVRLEDRRAREEIVERIKMLRLAISGDWIPTYWKAVDANQHVYDPYYNTSRFWKLREPHTWPIEQKSIGKTQLMRLGQIEEEILPLLNSDKHLGRRLERALRMLEESFLRRADESLLFATIGIEALYSMGEQELRLKMALRTAFMLQALGYLKSTVYDIVWESYGIRSKFVHGAKFESARPFGLYEAMRKILRASIIGWTYSKCDTKKQVERYSESLEKSAVNPMVLESIEEVLMEAREIFFISEEELYLKE